MRIPDKQRLKNQVHKHKGQTEIVFKIGGMAGSTETLTEVRAGGNEGVPGKELTYALYRGRKIDAATYTLQLSLNDDVDKYVYIVLQPRERAG